ncbi:ATPB1-like protein [Mya arenaria]|uniref:ATPB1-like protein n=1 Tax=Mya arenaria TaxID=6604 RepID=A0ABY7ECF9_MYAAR|nr:ATPB1-like protein [Mya arenaria]
MSYDQVGYSDKQPISSSNEFTDDPYGNRDPNGNGHGNGIYNDYTTEIKPKQYNQGFSFLCCSCQNTKKVKFILAASVVVVILSVVLIIISAVAHKNKDKDGSGAGQPQITKLNGLFAYGPDDTGLLELHVSDHGLYMPYVNRMEGKMQDQACMQTAETFGENCQNFKLYGALELRPCILLVLTLEADHIPEPFNLSDPANAYTEEDKKALVLHTANGTSENMLDGGAFVYSPKNGFPTYFYAQKTRGLNYISPGVMVQLNHVPVNQKVTIRCTAWAKNFHDGHPETSNVYTTEFSVLLKN